MRLDAPPGNRCGSGSDRPKGEGFLTIRAGVVRASLPLGDPSTRGSSQEVAAMPPCIEIRGSGPPELFPLDRDRITIGRGEENDVPIRDDKLVSHVHAVIESYR